MALPPVEPIIPVPRKEPFDDSDWLFDVKCDGFRALCYVAPGRCRLVSRNGNVFGRFATLGGRMAATLTVEEVVIDGEVIAADATGRPQFWDLLRGARVPAYVAFDL